MNRLVVPGLLAAILVGGGVLHGVWTDRWAQTSEALVAEAGGRVREFPLRIGSWEGKETPWAEVEPLETIETIRTRRYVNRLSGRQVGVLLGCGHPRNLAMFHTPLECYPASGYALAANPGKYNLQLTPGAPPAEFQVCDFKIAKASLTFYVRVFWSWTGDGRWKVPEQPRLSFGPFRVLYKLYVSRPLVDPDEPIEDDPCLDFLREALPEFERSAIRAQ